MNKYADNQADTVNFDAGKTEGETQGSRQSCEGNATDARQSWRVAMGKRISDVCAIIGNQMQAAIVAGVSISTLQRYIRGEVDPSLEGMVRIARQAGISLDWLATGEGPRRPSVDAADPYQVPPDGVKEEMRSGPLTTQPLVNTGDSGVKVAVALSVAALGDQSQGLRPDRLADLVDAAHQLLQAGADPALVRRLIAAAAHP
jgi:transcriptional regulator with XRE-family HTH domain